MGATVGGAALAAAVSAPLAGAIPYGWRAALAI